MAKQLSAAGINALTIDNRGFGESGGPRFELDKLAYTRLQAGDKDEAVELLHAERRGLPNLV